MHEEQTSLLSLMSLEIYSRLIDHLLLSCVKELLADLITLRLPNLSCVDCATTEILINGQAEKNVSRSSSGGVSALG